MHIHTIEDWSHNHDFSVKNNKGERRTKYVLAFTAITMVVEIIAGSVYGSMALLADGWHMGTHVAAFAIAIFAYQFARTHADNPSFSFGTGKVNALGGFASAVALVVVALVMFLESVQRIFNPHQIQFDQAIIVAVIGLSVNIVCAFLLRDDHEHHHHGDHGHHHHDHNLKAAYMHVIADALTSLLAIAALIMGKYLGWNWMDALMGVVGAVIISKWSYGLMKETGPLLLDTSIDDSYKQGIIIAIENDTDNRISDLHIWRVGSNHYAAIISIVTHAPRPASHYKDLLSEFHKLSHITIEVNSCSGSQ